MRRLAIAETNFVETSAALESLQFFFGPGSRICEINSGLSAFSGELKAGS